VLSWLSPSARREATVGILAGLILVATAWISSGALAQQLSPVSPAAAAAVAAAVPAPATATPIPTSGCVSAADVIAKDGFDPYAILAQKRPDVLAYYIQNGWNPLSQCHGIFDDWARQDPDGNGTTAVLAYVKQKGWASGGPVPTPTPYPDCSAPPAEVARLEFDPYAILSLNRPDVLSLYARNPSPDGNGNWDPATQCVAIFDNWLKHPDGGPPATAAQFVQGQGWAPKRSGQPASVTSVSSLDRTPTP